MKHTPLFDAHVRLGGKLIDFGGWELPVQYSGIGEEHHAVRTAAGLFDVSHMGEVTVKGKDAERYLNMMLTNDVEKLKIGRAQYTAMCYEDGGTVDDLLVYKLDDASYLLVVNAANSDKDFQWLQKHTGEFEVRVENVSQEWAQLAIQGPKAEKIVQTLTHVDLSSIRFFGFVEDCQIAGVPTLVSRTGYTGEDGFELYCPATAAEKLFAAILEAGKDEGLLPCGLGARDTLRFEANLALYGQELTRDISPLEAGIGFAVKTQKEAYFIGKEALHAQKEAGLTRKLVGVEMIDRGIPRHGYEVVASGKVIGTVTSGTKSPTLEKSLGLAILDVDHTELATEVYVNIRGKERKAQVVSTPFYKRG